MSADGAPRCQAPVVSKCPAGYEDYGGKCYPPCPAGQVRVVSADGAPRCQAPVVSKCPAGYEDYGGKCYPPCPAGQRRVVTDGAPQCAAP